MRQGVAFSLEASEIPGRAGRILDLEFLIPDLELLIADLEL